MTTSVNGDKSYWLTRIVFLRSLAFVYHVAFLVALFQNKQLIGRKGLLPADLYLEQIRSQIKDRPISAKVTAAPTLLWLVDADKMDVYLDGIAYAGLLISLFIMVTGAANMIALVALWILYHSLVSVGQTWYSFGWESQLLETGFLAIFFCPLWSWKRLPEHTPPSTVVIWGNRWLIFRIMIGAGMIKVRGDQCWRDLTCMDYHYETQPVPSPNSYFMHHSPAAVHKLEVLSNHFAELLAPALVLVPLRMARIIGGIVQIVFMTGITISGNLSFLNHLTMLPTICCFDDRFLSFLFSKATKDKIALLQLQASSIKRPVGFYIRKVMDISLFALLAYLSIPVVQNLCSRRQVMNTSFDPLRIVNTYGAFGSITRERTEVVMQGTTAHDPYDSSAQWLEYEFKCKPGNVTRRPCYISPYHYRLDWLMWFAAFQNYQHNPWLVHLVAKMLNNDAFISELLEHNPFLDKDPPRFIRLQHYKYEFSNMGGVDATKGRWWRRRLIGEYMPPVRKEQLEGILNSFGWNRKV